MYPIHAISSTAFPIGGSSVTIFASSVPTASGTRTHKAILGNPSALCATHMCRWRGARGCASRSATDSIFTNPVTPGRGVPKCGMFLEEEVEKAVEGADKPPIGAVVEQNKKTKTKVEEPQQQTSLAARPLQEEYSWFALRLEASIKELAAQVKLTQTYGNDAALPIAATYSFPIPVRAVVCSFVMIKQGGTRVVGRVQEKEEARKTYDAAIVQGQQVSLMEQQHPDVFQVSVGNIPPKEQVKIELVYATELTEDEENDLIRFHLPIHIGARYGTAPQSAPSTAFISSSSKTPFLKIAMSVEALAPIAKIGCPSHAVSTELGPDPTLPSFKDLPFANYARVSLSSDSALDKDFVLSIKSAGLDAPRCVAELHPDPSKDTVALALTLIPRFKLPDLARQEFIILVDRSGSMQGARIAAARRSLIISFGTSSSALWPEGSKPYNQQTLEEATRHVDGMHADYGGTEIQSALEHCFMARTRGRPTSVLVLTDGQVWDLGAVLGSVKTAVAAAPDGAPLRVSVLGIGDAVSTAMCEGIARVGNGTCMFVGEQETGFTGKIARLLKAARAPVISNISVDWGRPQAAAESVKPDDDFEMVEELETPAPRKTTLNVFDETVDPTHIDETDVPAPPPVVLPPTPVVQQSPFKIRNPFPGTRLNVYAILKGQSIPPTVILRGSTADGAEIALLVPVTLSRLQNDPSAPPAVHALAARKIIQDLEDGQHALVEHDADLLARTVKARIIKLGTMYAIASAHTSVVAVDESASGAPPIVPAALAPAPAAHMVDTRALDTRVFGSGGAQPAPQGSVVPRPGA
ncbi:vault protein inter-alpha-trypsin domain-containing protein [Mycena maculata]|uniref:Vault protein inter-alpha-trypsin domain-containing protein n=1 Tax=Mycena maculata TaxID=230809 RepID=A0AAD7I5J7_9AGAR|nr:vault protein inter-alpha-trypsin domain-containing protein [Mycena maculata]